MLACDAGIVPIVMNGAGQPLDVGRMLCAAHHRLLYHSDGLVRIRDGLPEFVPPRWIDPAQQPRRQPAFADAA